VAISRDIKVWLCYLSGAKDISNSGDNGTLETMTFIADDRGKARTRERRPISHEENGEQWEVVCRQVTNSMSESARKLYGGLMSTGEYVDLSENL
jgi:hypothetical protein